MIASGNEMTEFVRWVKHRPSFKPTHYRLTVLCGVCFQVSENKALCEWIWCQTEAVELHCGLVLEQCNSGQFMIDPSAKHLHFESALMVCITDNTVMMHVLSVRCFLQRVLVSASERVSVKPKAVVSDEKGKEQPKPITAKKALDPTTKDASSKEEAKKPAPKKRNTNSSLPGVSVEFSALQSLQRILVPHSISVRLK